MKLTQSQTGASVTSAGRWSARDCSETAQMKFPVAVDSRRERPLLTQSVRGKQSQRRTSRTPPQTLIKPVRGNKICSYTTLT